MNSQIISAALILYILLTAATGVAYSERTWLVGLLSGGNLLWAILQGRREEKQRRRGGKPVTRSAVKAGK